MRYAIVVGLVTPLLFVPGQASAQGRGLVSFKATIVQVHDQSLELSLSDPNRTTEKGKSVRFEIDKNARFEEVEFEVVDGNLRTSRKRISLVDLVPTQSIHVVAIVVADRPTILVGVVAGEKSSGAEALKLIARLGGTVRTVPYGEDEVRRHVDLSNSNITDDALALIASLSDLGDLDLSNTKITDKGVAHLANHSNLSGIKLSGTRVTNGVLTHLSTLRTLFFLNVDQTDVTRDAVVRFAKRHGLRTFCQISAGPKCEYRVLEEIRTDRDDFLSYVYLMKRNVYYGRFYPNEKARRTATTYYHRDGPVGAVLRRFEWFPREASQDQHSDARLPASVVGLISANPIGIPSEALACLWSEPAIGVVELNAGTIAAYGRPFQTIDFYNDIPELKPFNFEVDGKAPPFGFIEDARSRGCNVRVIEGPFKKSVRKDAPRGFYSAIFLDITVQQRENPNAIKKEDVHFDLLTQEALRDLMDKTTPDGVVCFHTSHRTHEFYKPLSAAAAALGFASKRVYDDVYDRRAKPTFTDESHFSSEWLVVARSPEHLSRFRSEKSPSRNLTWSVPPSDDAPAWRDAVEPDMPIRPR